MQKPKVYLFGRISELTYEEAISWRVDVEDTIGDEFEVLSPMRGKFCLANRGKLSGAYPDYLLCRADTILLRDETDLQRCDVALGYSTPDNHPGKCSWAEMGYLWALRKPIILVADPQDRELRDNAFLQRLPCLAIVDCLDDAYYLLWSLFNL